MKRSNASISFGVNWMCWVLFPTKRTSVLFRLQQLADPRARDTETAPDVEIGNLVRGLPIRSDNLHQLDDDQNAGFPGQHDRVARARARPLPPASGRLRGERYQQECQCPER